jgi:hypothetical protein
MDAPEGKVMLTCRQTRYPFHWRRRVMPAVMRIRHLINQRQKPGGTWLLPVMTI